MTSAPLLVAAVGWLAALGLLLEMRRRAALVRDADHELRGPLTAITLGLEALRRQPIARRRAEGLLSELGRAELALEDLAAALRGRRASVREERLRLDELVHASGEAWAGAAEGCGGGVVMDWPEGPASVRGDRRRLVQAFGNLLANAVEHGGGDVLLRGRAVGDAIRVEISDGGSFAAPAARRRFRGRGLAIAERALRGAGGRLDAHPRAGGGRSVRAELPLDPAPPPLDAA